MVRWERATPEARERLPGIHYAAGCDPCGGYDIHCASAPV